MGKFYILVFIVSVVIIIYVINNRLKQKEREKHLTDDNDEI